ncbi:MAG: GntR family transcriptional regulator [Erysipelothrix sp.]|nr:GntR family transcriptional regulator [Erysipelothrix sp.]
MELFESTKPIYLQIMELIKKEIAIGKLPPGSQMASVRELAMQYQVNPNTVQRALSELEREGLVKSDRTVGRFINDQSEMIEALKNQMIEDVIGEFIKKVKELNIDENAICSLIERYLSREERKDD